MAKHPREDSAMTKVHALYEKSGLTLQELGVKMGYKQNPRQSAFQFMKTGDPRISMLRRFANAFDIPIEELLQPAQRK